MFTEQQHLQRVAAIAEIEIPVDARATSQHIILGKRRFHFLEWGQPGAPGLLFLHGGNQTCHTWNVICAALSPHYHCIALDQRGHGDSEWSYEGDYAPSSQALDIEAMVQYLGWSGHGIIGMSMGCANGLAYAVQHAADLGAFVAIDAGPFMEYEKAGKIAEFVGRNQRHSSLDDYVKAAAAFNPKRHHELLRYSLRRNLRRSVDGQWEWKTDARLINHVQKIAEEMKDLAQHIDRLECPVLVMRGAQSKVFSDANAKQFSAALKNGRTVTIGGAGHSIQGDNPAGLLRELQPFLESAMTNQDS